MPDTIISRHSPSQLGAPFSVILADSVRLSDEGTETIPDFVGMVQGSGMARLWRDQRLTGPELHYLRKSAQITREALGAAIGGTAQDIEGYETGPRPMTIAVEKYIRLHIFNALRRLDPSVPRVDEMINYLEWTFEEWRPSFHDVGDPLEIVMSHHPTGWHEHRNQRI